MPKIAAKDSNKNVTIAPHGTGKVIVGTGAADATLQSDGDHNLILQTGNSTTGKIEIADGANGNIDLTPNGTGEVDIPKVDIDGGAVDGVTLGTNSAVTEAQIDNINIDGNAITSTDTNGNIALTPNGTGEVDISKVDIDGGAIDGTTIATSDVTVGSGKTLDVSAGSLTTATAQKQAIVDGANVEGTAILSTGETGASKFLREDGDDSSSWQAIAVALPSQSGNANKLLTTDGSDASWTDTLNSSIVFPAGHVIKFEESDFLETVQISVNASPDPSEIYGDVTGFSDGITPLISGSKLLVSIWINLSLSLGGHSFLRIKRTGPSTAYSPVNDDGTNLGTFIHGLEGVTNSGSIWSGTFSWVDTAQDNSTIHTYQVQAGSENTNTVSVNVRYSETATPNRTGTSGITIMEISV